MADEGKRGVSSRSQGVRSSKKKPNSTPFSPVALEILKLLGAGNIARDVAKTVPRSKSTVSYWKDRFLLLGALRSEHVGVYKTYSLSRYGSKILTGSEELRESCKLEDHAVKFLIIESERVPIDWVKLGEPRNWVKLGVRIGDVRVVRTSRNVIVHPGQLWGFDPDELLLESGRIVERAKSVLERSFGMMISSEGTPLHKPIFRFYSKEAGELVEKFGTTIVEGVGSLDNSPPERVPHEEFYSREIAKQRLLMPMRLRSMEEQIGKMESAIANNLKTFSEDMKNIVGDFKKSMQAHLNVIDVFKKESESRSMRSQEALDRVERVEKVLVVLVEAIKKKKRKSHKPKPKPKSRWQKLRKKLRI